MSGAWYLASVWWDGMDQDGGYVPATCDLLLAFGENRTLLYLSPPGQDLQLAYYMFLQDVRPGWQLLEGQIPRLLAAGITVEEFDAGDDDDGDDDDDSAGGSVLDQLPSECLPGDDDDSAGDDDDSAGS